MWSRLLQHFLAEKRIELDVALNAEIGFFPETALSFWESNPAI